MKVKKGTASSVSFDITAHIRCGSAWNSAGGLIRWPARFLVPVGFCLLSLQGVSELIKRIAFLKGLIPDPLEKHEVPLELAIARDEAAK